MKIGKSLKMWTVYKLKNKEDKSIYIGIVNGNLTEEWEKKATSFERIIIGKYENYQKAKWVQKQIMIFEQSFMPGKGYNVWEKDSI